MPYIARKGITDYEILTPDNTDEKVLFAVKELQRLFQEASGCALEAVTERSKKNAIILSVGNEGNDGFSISTQGKNYVILGNDTRGVVFGVYALCRFLFDLEFFTPDVYDITKGDIAFKEITFSSTPDIPMRALGIYPVHVASKINGIGLYPHCLRMGVEGMCEDWGLAGHTYFKVLPPQTYKEAHPDWYSTGDEGKNLCLTNEAMRKEFVAQMKEIIRSQPKCKCFMLGQEDTKTFCECENCRKAVQEADGYKSAVMLDFTNAVVKELNEWMREIDPTREVQFATFAYNATFQPPVKKIGEEYRSLYNKKLEPNLAIMIAAFAAQGSVSYFDERNRYSFDSVYFGENYASLPELIRSWQKVQNKLFMWTYHCDYYDSVPPFNDFDAIQENYRHYKDLGVYYLFEEGVYSRDIPNFNNLRVYVYSKMAWDRTLNVESLIDRFMEGYFGREAAKDMRAYFDFLRAHCRYITKELGRPMLYAKFDDFDGMAEPKYWSKEVVIKAIELHKVALEKATGVYRQRVREEVFPMYYLLLLHYADGLSKADRKEYAVFVNETVEKYGLTKGEGALEDNYKKLKEIYLRETDEK